MEAIIDQTLQKGVEAHRSGQLDEAGRLYRIVLKTSPNHPDANHNLGVLEVTTGNVEKAVSYLRAALKANPNAGQYWISYINVLIKINAIDEARDMLHQARERGAKGEVFNQLEQKLATFKKGLSIISAVEKFYSNSKSIIVNNAAQGWVYTATVDTAFMKDDFSISDEIKISSGKEDRRRRPVKNSVPTFSAGQTIDQLNKQKGLVEKFNKLKALIKLEDPNLIDDSFKPDADSDIFTAQERTFKKHGLNIVIIGAGVTGLYLANIIKYTLGNDVNVLILDNRSSKQHTREPFDREWLTHIPCEIVQKYTPPNIRELLECFGTDELIGLQINMLETVLMLSCKEQGVNFYFSPKFDYSTLNNKFISFIFDATGGRLTEYERPTSNRQKSELKLRELVKNFKYDGINLMSDEPLAELNDAEVTLKASGDFHFPYNGNCKIHTHLIKLTGIPESLLEAVYDFIEPRNASNLFFVWKGALKNEFNEGLVFINLTNKEHALLTSRISKSMNLENFLRSNRDILSSLDANIKPFLQMLVTLGGSGGIKINRPFSYSPHINLNAEVGYIGEQRIFPIGDSYFCGNPKVGNGLWTHLGFINDLVQEIATAHKFQASQDA